MKYILYAINSVFVLLMVAVAALFMAPLLPIEHNLQLKIVESGSMEPSIMTGSLVAIWPRSEYRVGEVITFKNRSSAIPTTHRIADTYTENGRLWFITKGDANEEADTEVVAPKDIIGSVHVAVPYAGFILDFARQPLGFTFLILLPALLLIMGEVEKIWKELKKRRQPKVHPKMVTQEIDTTPVQPSPSSSRQYVQTTSVSNETSMMDIATPAQIKVLPTLDLRGVTPYPRYAATGSVKPNRWLAIMFAGLFCAAVVGSSFFGSTVSYFNDIEASMQNTLQAITLDFVVVSDGSQYSFEDGELVGDDDGALVTIVTPEPGSVDLRHDVSVSVTGGNALLCEAVHASSTVPVLYGGPLSLLAATDVLFDMPWSLSLSLPDSTGFFDGEQCFVDIIFTAWHFEESTDQGYYDEERTPLSFTLIDPDNLPAALAVAPLTFTTLNGSTTSNTTATSTASESESRNEVAATSESVSESGSSTPETKPTESPIEKVEEPEEVEVETGKEPEDSEEKEIKEVVEPETKEDKQTEETSVTPSQETKTEKEEQSASSEL